MGSRLSLYARISLTVMANTLSLSLSPPSLYFPLIASRLRLRAPPLTFTSHRLTYEPLAALFQPPPIPRLHRLRNVISNVTLPPSLSKFPFDPFSTAIAITFDRSPMLFQFCRYSFEIVCQKSKRQSTEYIKFNCLDEIN